MPALPIRSEGRSGPVLASNVDTRDPTFRANVDGMQCLLDQLTGLLAEAAAGGGPRATERHVSRGKLPVRERIALLLDRDSPFLEISPLAGYYTDYHVGGGMVLGLGVVEGTECVIVGNDPTDLGGAMTAVSIRKLLRGLEIARENRLPYLQFVESAGGDLRGLGAGDDPEATMRRNLTHFAETGRMFHDITELSAHGIPTISVVFGSSTAGGAYQPGLSDYNIFVRGGAKVFLGGPPLVKVATGEDAVDEELGGADMHGTVSGLADYLADDEHQAIRMARQVVAHLQWRKLGPGPATAEPEPPHHDPEELLGLMPIDLRSPVDAREIIARIVDGSRFEEFKARYGPTLVTGWAQIHGFPVGILANNGVLFSDSSQKATQFIQLCNQSDTPLLFLQHITGYMVGREYERGGIVKHGSQMINALSNSTVPHVTVILGSSWGRQLRHGRSGLRHPVCLPLADGQDRHHGAQADGWGHVDRAPGAGRQAGPAGGRGDGSGHHQGGRGLGRGPVAGPVRHRPGRGRRDHRPSRHPHGGSDGPVRVPQRSGPGRAWLRSVPDVMRRLLIANRGEIARRIVRTASTMGIATVAVYAEDHAAAPYVTEADRAVALPGTTAAETYLNIEALLHAARVAGADAVHPGYGFLSERALFARAVIDSGLTWVGPPPEVIDAMGDKLAAKQIMAAAGVPTLPSWQTGDADVHFPVLVKAAAGGGGKGMRIVESAGDLAAAVAGATREAEAAFGDGTVFLERYVGGARHVEIQILADNHGHAIHLFERDCSIQRRHQKVIEEAPSPAVDDELHDRMGAAAMSAADAAGYRNAGTVEFVVEPPVSPGKPAEFWFLEVNTRLQVEHPVTEAVTGLDLVREQLLVAQGLPLSVTQADLSLSGHAVEARLYAEDPASGFLPHDRNVGRLGPGPRSALGFGGRGGEYRRGAVRSPAGEGNRTRAHPARSGTAVGPRPGTVPHPRHHHQSRLPRRRAAASRFPGWRCDDRVHRIVRGGIASGGVGRRATAGWCGRGPLRGRGRTQPARLAEGLAQQHHAAGATVVRRGRGGLSAPTGRPLRVRRHRGGPRWWARRVGRLRLRRPAAPSPRAPTRRPDLGPRP